MGFMLKLLIAVSSFGESLRWEFLTALAEAIFSTTHWIADYLLNRLDKSDHL